MSFAYNTPRNPRNYKGKTLSFRQIHRHLAHRAFMPFPENLPATHAQRMHAPPETRPAILVQRLKMPAPITALLCARMAMIALRLSLECRVAHLVTGANRKNPATASPAATPAASRHGFCAAAIFTNQRQCSAKCTTASPAIT